MPAHPVLPRSAAIVAAAVLAFGLGACRPDSVTGARDQLGRGGARAVGVALPITLDTVTIDEFLPDSNVTTTVSGIAGILLDPESTDVAVGDRLDFDDLDFDPFAFSYDQMLTTAEVSTSVVAPGPSGGMGAQPPVDIDFATPDGSDVTSAVVQTGWVVRTVTNSTDCDATVGAELTDADGDAVVTLPDIAVAQGGGSVTDSVSLDGAAFDGAITVTPSADFGVCVPTGGQATSDLTFRALSLASVQLQNVNETFTDNYAPLASETGLRAVDTVVAETGAFTTVVRNRLPVVVVVDLTLAGATRNGAPLTRSVIVPAAPGDGSQASAVTTFDLADATILPDEVLATVDGIAAASTVTVTPLTTTDAIVVEGGGAFEARALAGDLDPTVTEELTVDVESVEEVDRGSVDFGDFEDAVRNATLNDANIGVVLANGADAPLVLNGFTLGLVELDPTGAVPRDAAGAPVYETDEDGQPILVPVTDPGQPALTLPRNGSSEVDLDGAPLIDRLVALVLDDRRAAIVAAGSAAVGDGQPSRISRSDAVQAAITITVGLDITIPDSGVTFSRNNVFDGLDMDLEDADEIERRVQQASVSSSVVNGTPFAVEVDLAFVAGDLGDADVFQMPDRVQLAPVAVAVPALDANGRVTGTVADSVTLALSGTQLRPLLGAVVTASIRLRLVPSAAAGGRGAFRIADPVIVNAAADVVVRGGSQ